MNGTPCLCAILANFSKSRIETVGLVIDSPNTALVLGLKYLSNSSSGRFWSTNVHSIPIFFMVTPKRLNVPPYIDDDAMKWSPASQMLKTA